MTRLPWKSLAVLVGLAVISPVSACSLCLTSLQQCLTYRQDAERARVVLHGTAISSQLSADGASGTTELRVDSVVKGDRAFTVPRVVTLSRYVPVDPKEPLQYLVFCDLSGGKLDTYRGPRASAAVADYLRGALAVDSNDRTALLRYYFKYLEHADAEIAADAFLEFAKATDREIGEAAAQPQPEKLRGWLKSSKTPPQRFGMYAFLLGACGGEQDTVLFRGLLRDPGELTSSAFDGILGGYIHLRPKEGWEATLALLGDERKPFPLRYAALRTLRFYHGWKPKESQEKVLAGLGMLLPQGDMADLAVEDLRRWQVWDLTKLLLAQYSKPSHAAPIMRRAIVRYALCCPLPEAAAFVAERRKAEPDTVRDVEETLQFEKTR